MQYMGGKNRIAKQIVAQLPLSNGVVWEPFMGGGAVTEHLAQKYPVVHASDIHEDLMLMWQAVKDGWVPPTDLSEAQWRELKDAPPSALRGFAGFGCSFGGKWFGGYTVNSPKHGPAMSSRSVMRFAPHMSNVNFKHKSYDENIILSGDVVYCDPPYADTTRYGMGFDHEAFWQWATVLSSFDVRVYVSEYQAPEGWVSVWEKEQNLQLDVNKENKQTRIEKLWVYDG